MPAFLRPASLQSALSYACCCDSNNIFSLLNLRHLSPCSSLVPQIFQLDAQVCSLIDERLIWLELKSIVSIFLVTFGVSALLCIVYILNNHHLILIVYLMGWTGVLWNSRAHNSNYISENESNMFCLWSNRLVLTGLNQAYLIHYIFTHKWIVVSDSFCWSWQYHIATFFPVISLLQFINSFLKGWIIICALKMLPVLLLHLLNIINLFYVPITEVIKY